MLRVISDYSLALRLLDQYNHQQLRLEGTRKAGLFVMTYEATIALIDRMAETMGPLPRGLFGRKKDKGMASAIGDVNQTFDGKLRPECSSHKW